VSTADTYGFWLGSFFHSEKLPAFALLAGLVVTFLCLRVNTRLIRKGVSWWPGNIRRGNVHVHHVVIGLPVMFVAGVVEFAVHPGSPWVELLAMFFGGAAGAVLDEFALILHLRDVYWEHEGRKSIMAVFLGTSFTAFMLVGMIPLGYSDPLSQSAIIEWAAFGAMILNLAFVVVAFLKGKLWMGWVGLFLPIVASWAAVRLGQPRSVWARWRYSDKPLKMARAERRSHEFQQRWGSRSERLITFLSGVPHDIPEDHPGLARTPALMHTAQTTASDVVHEPIEALAPD
jgi:lysyl-tRNA synthetase class 2